MSEVYRTVSGAGSAAFEIQGSRFIGQVRPVRTVGEAESVIDEIEAEYADATHNVPAYRVRATPMAEWSSDAREPAGSAGKPALNVLQMEEVENVVAVITRYYGGTKLGVGGLARSYGRAVKLALEEAGIERRRPRVTFSVTVTYDDSGTVRGILEGSEADFEATYEGTVQFDVLVPESQAEDVRDRIRSATSGRADFSSP